MNQDLSFRASAIVLTTSKLDTYLTRKYIHIIHIIHTHKTNIYNICGGVNTVYIHFT